MTQLPVTPDDIRAAHARVLPHIRKTPVIELARGALGGDFTPVFKLEFTQHAGSFKTRGAFNSILSNRIGAAGVAAASGGNHGAAVAYAARTLGVKARIFVPEISPQAKVAAIRRFGADVVIGGAQYDDAQAACDAYVAETGAFKIHPFSAEATIAGQGTLALEWAAETKLDTVVIAVGGGGLGDLGIRYGYQRFMPEVMRIVVAVLVVLVQSVQTLGDWLARKANRRIRHG